MNLYRCLECFALTAPDDESAHKYWHERQDERFYDLWHREYS